MEKGTHEAIVSQKLFDDVQYVLSENGKKNGTRNTNRPDFPLRQFVRCRFAITA
jgi:hypothetical protein